MYLIHPAYCPNILSFAHLAQFPVRWEVWDNYQKQTYRNRCHICTDQGRHSLHIPIKHAGGSQGRQLSRQVRVDNSYSWQRQHWRSLQTAYRASPFFEYYEDALESLYSRKFDLLLDFTLEGIAILCQCLQLSVIESKTTRYEIFPDALIDARFLVQAKREVPYPQQPYVQVFQQKHGFVRNLSVLDLLFNMGPHARIYLLELPLPPLSA